MKKVLITGSDSFIGKYFLRNAPEFHVEEFDIQNCKIKEIDFSGCDVVFHVAAIVHQTKAISDETYFAVNRDLAFQVAKAAKLAGVTQFVFMSTVKVFGENTVDSQPWTESSECLPQDAYGKSKYAAEKLLNELESEDFVISIVRTPLVYGPGVKGNVAKMATLIKKSSVIPLGNIKNKRSMVYVGNLVAIIKRVIEKQHSGIVLASDNRIISTSEFIRLLMDGCDEKHYLMSFPAILKWGVKYLKPSLYQRIFGSLEIDSTRSFEKLEFKAPFSVAEGLKDVMKDV